MWDPSCDKAEARQQEAVEAVQHSEETVQHSEEAVAKTPEAGIRQIVTAAESKIQLRPFKALNSVSQLPGDFQIST